MKKSLIYAMCLLIAVLMSVNNTSGQIPTKFYGKNIIQSDGEATTLYSAEKNPSGIEIANELVQTKNDGTPWMEDAVKKYADENDDNICGIYEASDKTGYKLGCIKQNGEYILIYLGSKLKMSLWKMGDKKATLRPSATTGFFKADWLMADKSINSDFYVVFDGGSMKFVGNSEETFYLKMYPTTTSSDSPTQTEKWSGSGFALSNRYLCTNYHVVDEAKTIRIFGVQGDFTTSYSAKVIASDKVNDLAILKVDNADFSGFGIIPYNVKTTMDEVGEDIFVLGYPLTATMGDEVKLTTGVISSRTGFQGDVSMYQISAPIQPGNSGGPLFDSKGDLVGIVSARHIGAENVGYAVKASYLRNLIESSLSEDILPKNNTISSQPLTGKVSKVKNFVFYIVCSSQEGQIAPIPSNTTISQDKSKNNSNTYEEYEIPEGTPIYIDVKDPHVDLSSNKGVTVKRVRVTDSQTIVDMEYDSEVGFDGVGINPETVIRYNGGTCSLVDAINIPKTPEYYYFREPDEKLSFTLVFQGIPKTTFQFDLIEPNGRNPWKFYGIILNSAENQNEISNVTLDVTNPYVERNPTGVTIKRVRVTDVRTYIDIEICGYDSIGISPKTVLRSNLEYPLIKAVGIPTKPQKCYFADKSQKLQFTLIFPDIPRDVSEFKIISDGWWLCRGMNPNESVKIDVKNPYVRKSPVSLTIERVRVTDEQTVVDFKFHHRAGTGWANISSSTYIVPDTGTELKLTKAYGIPIAPKSYIFHFKNENLFFTLFFPALPENTTKFDLIEPNGIKPWKFYEISLE
ncbi:MAG: serine protease [Bacteroidales bacterium]|nr:serine protease [Bacteroidales bacterium]